MLGNSKAQTTQFRIEMKSNQAKEKEIVSTLY
jgi:hypothetical protein